jgi:LacI family transcriptional regulator
VSKKITTFDISNKLGISRNTVSKALNNHPGISDETKRKVIDQAFAMGYKKIKLPFDKQTVELDKQAKSIAFLTKRDVRIEAFWMNVMSGVEEIVSGNGYEMKLHFIKTDDLDAPAIPQLLNSGVDGFIVGGSISKSFNEKLLEVELPKVFIDLHSDMPLSDLQADIVLMENEDSVYRITRHLIETGHTEIGYIGDLSIRSFKERWLGFATAMQEANLPLMPHYCITADSPTNYQYYEDVSEALAALRQFPTAIVCANDIIALNAVKFLRNKGMTVPGDVAVTGFDQIKETEFLDFSLTTVHNDEFQLGLRAAEELLLRLRSPNRPYELIRLFTKVIIGDSTTLAIPGS